MPWYKVPVTAYIAASSPGEALERVLALVASPGGPLCSAGPPVELSAAQADSHLRLREILDQAQRDSASGLLVTDPRWPGMKLTPGAAASLAALEFEDLRPE